MEKLLWAVAVVWMIVIFYLGGSRFGRSGTQGAINRFMGYPRLFIFLDRHHGAFRATFHYVEFSVLTLLLYAALGLIWKAGAPRALTAWAAASVYAWLDELHQSRTPGRQFRRIDFIHSLLGATLALTALLIFG